MRTMGVSAHHAGQTTTYLPTPGEGSQKTCAVLPGVGVGPQIIESILEIFDEVNIPLKIDLLENIQKDDKGAIEKLK